MIIFATKGKATRTFDANIRDVWNVPPAEALPFTRLHQSQKPVELEQKIILNSSKEGDVVLDCFMGSGTTAVACLNTNRHYIGFEIDEKFYNIALERIAKAKDAMTNRLF